MKNQGYSTGGGKSQGVGSKGKAFKHKHKHLGGKGLSLAAFANAKSKPAFNPSELRKQREYYNNAKNVKKYRKLVKRLEDEGHNNQLQIDTTTLEFGNDETEVEKKKIIEQHPYISDVYYSKEAVPTDEQKVKRKDMSGCYQKQKSKSTLEKMREDYEKQQQEKEQLRKEREAALAAKRAAQEKAEAKRKDMKSKMCRRTKSGQPIMKFRMEHLLDRIQNSN